MSNKEEKKEKFQEEKKIEEQEQKNRAKSDKKKEKAEKSTAKGHKKARGNKADEQIKALNDRLLRLQADFDNFRKRTLREKGEIYKRANEELMEELLPVIDHMDIALQAAAQHNVPEEFTSGFAMVGDKLVAVLQKAGLKCVESEGKEFDPNLHEAISHIPSDEVKEGHVITQTRRGFMLGDRLLRPAQVVVSSGKPE